MSNKRIVVLGAGFGGLRVALGLARKKQPVTLIDTNPYHTYTPLLYEIAITTKEQADYIDLKSIVTIPISEIIAGLPISFINEAVTAIDFDTRAVRMAGSDVYFDQLVIAVGTEPHYKNIPGARERALPFKTWMDAITIRDRLTGQPFLSQKQKVVIVGGGSTGVELAGEIQLSGLAQTTIVQAPPTILPGSQQKILTHANARLQNLGVEIIYDWITEVQEKMVVLKNRRIIDFNVLIWAGGTTASQLIQQLPLKKEEEANDRLRVTQELRCIPDNRDPYLSQNVYALGDTICFHPHAGKPLPGLASYAIDQADIIVKNILGKPTLFKMPSQLPSYVIPIGGKYAIAQIGPFVVSGFSAWLLKLCIELRYLLQIMPWRKALHIWIKGVRIFLANDRLG